MPPRPPLAPHRRWLLLALGWTCFALGVVGTVLPLVPTTPFMLVALWAFSSSSQRFHDWLYGHRVFGPPLQRWRRERVLPLWVKLVAVGSMAVSLGYATVATDTPGYALAVMGAIMLFGVAYISRIPSRPRRSATMIEDAGGGVRIVEAGPGELPSIRALLAAAALPDADVGAPNQLFLVARAGDPAPGPIAGCVALERYGDDVLLRSLAVEPARRGEGLGVALHAHALDRARGLGARSVYLLTTTAERFFARAGYARIDRAEVPPAVRASPEFAALCPASAVCMVRRLA